MIWVEIVQYAVKRRKTSRILYRNLRSAVTMSRVMRRGLTLVLALVQSSSGSDPSYDHQTVTYEATFSPVTVVGTVPIAPFFSPEHSTDTLTAMIEDAVFSVDIEIPSAGSWESACSGFSDDDAGVAVTCTPGCTPAEQRADPFPLFSALLNALHRGVKVRIITNDYGTPDCAGIILLMEFECMLFNA